MSFIKAIKFCRICASKKGKSYEIIDIVIDSLGDTEESWQEHSELRANAEQKCLRCDGRKPLVANYLEIEYALPIREASRRKKKEEERKSEMKIKRQEKREFHKKVAPGKVIELDLKRRHNK
jgi:hypothetical protein